MGDGMEKREKEILTERIGPIRKIAKAFRPRRGWLSCTHQISPFLSFTQMNIIHNRFHIYRNQTETFSKPTLQAAYNLSILRTSRDRVMRCPKPQPCTYLPESQVTNHVLFLWEAPRVEGEGEGPNSATLGAAFLS